MHRANQEWLADAQARFGYVWHNGSILEIGSLNINGSARTVLSSREYIGVDIVEGPDVDIVAAAETTAFERTFDCLLSTQMCEHDPQWRKSLSHNLQWLRPGGIFLLSWGAEGNPHHEPEPFAIVPVGDMIELLATKVEVLEACWEVNRYFPEWPGCYNIIARKRGGAL